ncbi:MAG: hypothetical protein ACFNO7_01760 [Bacteroides sp.]
MTFSGKSFLLTICGILFSLSLTAQHFNIGLGNPYSTSFKLAFSEARFDYTVKTFHLGAKFGVEDVFRKGFRNFYTGLYGGSRVVLVEKMSLVHSFGFGYFSPMNEEEKGSLYEDIDFALRYGKDEYYELGFTSFFLENKERPNYFCLRFSVGWMF